MPQGIDINTPVNNFIQALMLGEQREREQKLERVSPIINAIQAQLKDDTIPLSKRRELIETLPEIYRSAGIKVPQEGVTQLSSLLKGLEEQEVETGNTVSRVAPVREDAAPSQQDIGKGIFIPKSQIGGEMVIENEKVKRGTLSNIDYNVIKQRLGKRRTEEDETKILGERARTNAELELEIKTRQMQDLGYEKNPETVFEKDSGRAWQVYTNPYIRDKNRATVFLPLGNYTDDLGGKMTQPIEPVETESVRRAKVSAQNRRQSTTESRIESVARTRLGFSPDQELTQDQILALNSEKDKVYAEEFDAIQTGRRAGTFANVQRGRQSAATMSGAIPPSQTSIKEDTREDSRRNEDLEIQVNDAASSANAARTNMTNAETDLASEEALLKQMEDDGESPKKIRAQRDVVREVKNRVNKARTEFADVMGKYNSRKAALERRQADSRGSSNSSLTPSQKQSISIFRQKNKSAANLSDDEVLEILIRAANR